MEFADRGIKLFDDNHQRDYNHATDSNYKRLREQAEEFYKKRNAFSQQSQAAYQHGDRQRAHELSEQSQQALAQADNYNRQAAAYVFRENNTDSAQDEIDLHGLYVKEAEYFLQVRIVQFVKTHQNHLNVIVGKGLHSKNGVAKIKPAVDDMCRDAGLNHHIDSHNSGVLVINLQNVNLNQLPKSWLDAHGSAGQIAQPQPGYGTSGPQYQQQPHHQQQPYHQQQQQPHHQQQYNNIKTGNKLFDLLIQGICICMNSK